MAAGKVLVFLAGAGIAAGVVLANMTTPALRSYRADHPARQGTPPDHSDDMADGMVDGRSPRSDLSQQDYGYTRQDPAAGDDGESDGENDGSHGYADSDDEDRGSFGVPRWLAGPERWLEQQGWIAIPIPRQMGETIGRRMGQSRWQPDDNSQGYDDGQDGDSWQGDGDTYRPQAAPAPRGLAGQSAPAPDGTPGQSAFDRAFGSGPAPSGQRDSGPAGDAANAAAARARDAAADVLAAENRSHTPAH